MVVIFVEISKETMYPFLIYNLPYKYNDFITLYPLKMDRILELSLYSPALTVRKNSRFSDKSIIKMNYMEFIFYASCHPELELQYHYYGLSHFYGYVLALLSLVCEEQEISFDKQWGTIFINGFEITPDVFDDLRRIIILQNDIDFDMDEFLNYDTEKRLLKAQNDLHKNQDKSTLEDYIDSLSVALRLTENQIRNMTIRKFWRFIKRYNLHQDYMIFRTGECSGMVSFKEPIKHWMSSIEEDDKYKSLKTDEQALKSKIN